MKKINVLGLGELLWDIFADSRKPGGAPANVAFQLNQLGMNGIIVSRVGRDALGREILNLLQSRNVQTNFIQQDTEHPTGTVTVELDTSGTPSYVIHQNTAWDFLDWTPELENLLPTLSAVCFGTLAMRNEKSRKTIQKILDSVPKTCVKVYDVNLRQDFYSPELLETSLKKSNVAKMNHEELEVLRPILGLDKTASTTECALALCHKYELKKVCITRAAEGCLLVTSTGEIADVPGRVVKIADTVGSGDSFSAALIYATLRGGTLQTQAEFANEVGTLVATRSGGMPPLVPEFEELKSRYF